jgi:cation diffusion facilitator CzcD-associated flavoprotein CzcO
MHAAIRLPQRISNLDLTIYEKNPEIGGTWYENRYPGIACDVPAHSYTLIYEPNPTWTEFYAGGREILNYLKGVADKYKVRRYIKFNHKCLGGMWEESKGKWKVHIEGPNGAFDDECDVLITATGFLNVWKWPDIPGIHDFKGIKVHSAVWPEEGLNLTGKTVAVIGNGSSAIQIVPNLQKVVKQLYSFARGSTWISPPLANSKVEEHNPGGGNCSFPHCTTLIAVKFDDETLRRFKEDEEYFQQFRREIEYEQHMSFPALINGSDFQKEGQRQFTENMKKKLDSKPEIFKQLLPTFPPGCRRLTPGPGYLEALVQPNVRHTLDDLTVG